MSDHSYGSFDYKIISDTIKHVLNARSRLDNTVQLSMPFIKATTTLQLPNVLGNGNVGFTIGLHGIDEVVEWESMFSEQDSDMPLIGYTYDPVGNIKKIYAKEFKYGQGPSNASTLYTNASSVNRLPPPGITQATIGRNKNGLLASAQLNISVPSLLQLETLQKTFFIPGVGMIVEWGQQFPELLDEEKTIKNVGEFGLDSIEIANHLFPWNDRDKLIPLLQSLGTNKVGLPTILNNYVYPSQGQYMWMFGRVANFTISGNADGSYDCSVKIIGPSEDSWAYSTKNTVVPPKDGSTAYFCSSKTNSIFSYFNDTVPGQNFKTKLDSTYDPDYKSPWRNHVIKFSQKTSGKDLSESENSISSQKQSADLIDSYYISWRFFVNEVLNGESLSLKSSVFGNALTSDQLDKIGMLIPYANGLDRTNTNISNVPYLNDPYESFVGYNDALRSINLDTLIIVNEKAVELAKQSKQYEYIKTTKEKGLLVDKTISIFEPTEDEKKFIKGIDNAVLGTFDNSVPSVIPDRKDKNDSGFLSAGVWINHNAIRECMLSADTLMRGISILLDRMNAATANYWQLTLDTIEPQITGNFSYNYMVVDANYRDSSDRAVQNFIDNVYTFNKLVRKNDELVGSELISCTLDLSLPKKLFSQIATLGLVQPEDLEKAGTPPENKNDTKEDTVPKLSDPNDNIREIFSQLTTELFVSDNSAQGPDLTILPTNQRNLLKSAQKSCGSAESGTTAQTSGDGFGSNKVEISDDIGEKTVEELQEQKKQAELLVNSEECKLCTNCEDKKEAPVQAPVSISPPQSTTVATAANKKLSELTIGEILSVIKPSGKVFAMGKYQLVPDTFRLWINEDKVDKNILFNAENQEKAMEYLMTKKRPNVMKYIKGDSSVTITQAHVSLCQEFASIVLPEDTERIFRNGTKKIIPRGSIYYTDTQNKAGGKNSEENIKTVNDALIESRRLGLLKPIADVIAKYESSYDSNNAQRSYDVFNTGQGRAGYVEIYSEKYYNLLNPNRLLLSNIIKNVGAGGIAGAVLSAASSAGAGNVVGGVIGGIYEDGKLLVDLSYIDIANNKVSSNIIYDYCEGRYKTLCDAGFLNGRIDPNRLVPLLGNPKDNEGNTILMQREAAAQWNKLIEKAKDAGFNFNYTDGYRSLEEQVRLVRTSGVAGNLAPKGSGKKRGVAARYPGTSNHGWGLAVDLQLIPNQHSNRERAYQSPLYKWLKENASAYFFEDTVKTEAWHWEYTGPLTPQTSSPLQSPGGSTPTPVPTPTPTPVPIVTKTLPTGSVCDDTYEQLGKSIAPLRTGVSPLTSTVTPLRTNVSPLSSTVSPLMSTVAPIRTGVSSVPNYVQIGKDLCDKCIKAKNLIPQLDAVLIQKTQVENIKRKYPGMQKIFRYHEIFPDYMVATITSNANGNFANAFGASPGSLSISVDIELPGINGIRVGELFWIDKIPSFYKIFGAFQVLSIEDTIDVSGWTTKIHARFNYLGRLWKETMIKKLNSGEVIL